jgi:hypothetical protein
MEEDLAQAKSMIDECSKYAYDKRGTEWLKERIESWSYYVKSEQLAWEMECNGEMVAYEGSNHEAYVFHA